jgi:hypothetical protein
MTSRICILLLAPFFLSFASTVGCDDDSSGSTADIVDTEEDSELDSVEDSDTDTDGGTPGASWQVALEDYDSGAFFSAWGRSATDVFVAGGTDDDGALLHYDGSEWTEEPLPEDTPLLTWVFGIDDSLWVVGNEGTVLYRPDDDSDWEKQEIATSEPLWGIWGTSEDQLWTVGGDSFNGGEPSEGVVFSYNGSSWNEQFVPEDPEGVTEAFFKVWGTSSENVHVVGAGGRILHWDGEEWTGETLSPFRDLVSLWGSSPDDIFISGGRSEAILFARSDDGWELVNTGALSAPGMNGTWVEPSGQAGYSVGVSGTIIRFYPSDQTVEREPAPTTQSLHGVWGADGGQTVFAVGGVLEAGSLSDGVILMREASE